MEQNVVSIETGTDPYMPLTAPMGKRYGIALDIGTTTLAMALLSLETGKILATVSCLNPQRQISADVIGRIGAAISGQGDELQQMVRSAAELLLLEACRIAGIRPEEVNARVVTGNTTMLYLFTGRNPYTLSRAPFLADCLFGFSEQGIYYPSCFSAFVGADITCSVLASGMLRTQGTSMMIDLGTNGEIVLLHDGVLYGTSTAAGPAFEGGEISCGSMNVRGAIDRVRVREGSYEVHVLGDTEASSICGSGIIDAVAAFLELGRIDASGAIILLSSGSTLISQRAAYQEGHPPDPDGESGCICGYGSTVQPCRNRLEPGGTAVYCRRVRESFEPCQRCFHRADSRGTPRQGQHYRQRRAEGVSDDAC